MAKAVFISYSSKDIKEVKQITDMLSEAGITYWKAPEMIPAGSNYAREIPQAIASCQVVLLVISDASQESIWVEKEIDCAINDRKTIVPLKITEKPLCDMFRFYLNNVQTILYCDNPQRALEQTRERLLGLLGMEAAASVTETPLQPEGKAGGQTKPTEKKSKPPKQEMRQTKPVQQKAKETQSVKPMKPLAMRSGDYKPSSNVGIFDIDKRGTAKRSSNVGMGTRDRVYTGSSQVRIENRSQEMQREAIDKPAQDAKKRQNPLEINIQPIKCKKCGGKLKFISRGTYSCESCGFLNYDSFETIRNFLDKVGARPIPEIAKATGIPRKTIEIFLQDEMLEIPKGSPILLVCEGCGAGIRTGRLCEECKKNNIKLPEISLGENRYRYFRRPEE